ncbi:hypothetical protein UFOVP53_162 [uncultured Caudovirales phage]|uniref:Uncharacterized protein n=1 Tax=uncultured Caudovirales phage TaxID=2100421 RepID=A0A6J5KSU2_9CAUD|nr:hypothetical protein UFOVP53_162 [uncultured Caudovirales phage]
MSLLLQLVLLIIGVHLLKSKLNVSDEGLTYMVLGGISFSLIKNIALLIITFISGLPLASILVSLLIDSIFTYLLMKQAKLI